MMYIKSFVAVLLTVGTQTVAQEFPPITKLPANVTAGAVENEKALQQLGFQLFFDARLSGDGSTACADCHDPEYGFGDGADLGRGYPGTKHWRNSQSIVNAAFLSQGFHWDGSVDSLHTQVAGAMGTSFAFNMDETMAEERVRQVLEYQKAFYEIWGAAADIDKITMALTAYERSLVSADSPLDLYLGGDFKALPESAKRGLEIFNGKGNCIACHNGMLATDEKFYNTGVPKNPEFSTDPLRQVTFRAAMRGFGVEPTVYLALDRDPGRFAFTNKPEDLGAFRTAPLRYLKYTAPYMHNGAFFTLEEVVNFYNIGGTEDVFGTKSPLIKPLGLSDQEKNDLVAFLESMSGSEIIQEFPEPPDYVLAASPQKGAVTFASLTGGEKPEVVYESPPEESSSVETSSENLEIKQSTAAVSNESSFSVESSGLVVRSSNAADAGINEELESGSKIIVVQAGETLGSIAKRELGDVLKFQEIYQANRDRIPDPSNLVPGTKLKIPVSQ